MEDWVLTEKDWLTTTGMEQSFRDVQEGPERIHAASLPRETLRTEFSSTSSFRWSAPEFRKIQNLPR